MDISQNQSIHKAKANKSKQTIIMFSSNSILVIGASGRTGSHIIKAIATHSDEWTPKITALARDPAKLDSETASYCSLVVKGNARSETDLQAAIDKANADLVVISVGNGDNVGKTDIRTSNAIALERVLSQPQYKNVKVLVISSIGAGDSKIIAGFGIGKMIEFHLRHILKDHTGQEKVFLSSKELKNRTMVLRPTGLTEGESTGKVVMFGKNEKGPSMKTDRADLAQWAVEQMAMERDVHFGSNPVTLTCVN